MLTPFMLVGMWVSFIYGAAIGQLVQDAQTKPKPEIVQPYDQVISTQTITTEVYQ